MALFSKDPEKGSKVQGIPPSNATNSQPRTAELLSAALQPKSTSAAEEAARLGRGSKVNGRVSFDGSARLNGEVEGEISVEHTLHIGETATITARIKAATIVVAGKVRGDITGSQKIELCPSAMVTGNLSAPFIVIQEGARFEGHCSMPRAGGLRS